MSRFERFPPWLVRGAIGLVVFGVVAATAAVALLGVGRNQVVVLPAPTGPYAVGRAVYDWVDATREDSLAPSNGTRRELLVWVWYPASPASPGQAEAIYIPADWRRALEQDRSLIGTQLFQNLAAVRVHATNGAGLSDAEQRYPVLVFMPGYGNIVPYYTTLAEELASHGYVVAGINPTYTTTVVFPDGRITRRTAAGTIPETPDAAATQAAGGRLVGLWAADARFVLNRLEGPNAGADGLFAGRLDLSRIGVFGHSLGGGSALEACRLDSRCGAAIDLDGTPYGDVARLGLTQPAMFLLSGGSAGSNLAERAENVPGAGGDRSRAILTVAGTRHFNFSDYAVTFSPMLRLVGALGPIDGRRGLEITDAYVLEFLDHHLKGKPAPLLRGPSPSYPEVSGRFETGS